MKGHCDSIMGRVLILITGVFLAVTLLGCHDPIGADMEAEHRRLGNVVEQQLRQGQSTSLPTSRSAPSSAIAR